MCDLARCYYYGLGVDKSEEHSFYWYRKAAEADNDEAMFRLAEYFSANTEEAHRWYEKAAELRNNEAIQALTHQCSSKNENTFDIILEHIGDQKMTVISDVKSIFNLGLAQAVNLVESAPLFLKAMFPGLKPSISKLNQRNPVQRSHSGSYFIALPHSTKERGTFLLI